MSTTNAAHNTCLQAFKGNLLKSRTYAFFGLLLYIHNVCEGRSLIFTLVKVIFTNVRMKLMSLDRRNDRCMHYHDLDNQ